MRAIIPNKKQDLLPGQFVNIKVKIGGKKNAILIPKAAVQFGADGQFIYVAKNGKAKRINIVAGQSFEDYYVLQKGKVSTGEQAIVTGLENMNDGEKISSSPALLKQ